MVKFNVLGKFHKNHTHKIAGAFVAFGVWSLVFPEPVVSNIIGTLCILAGFFMAYVHDLQYRR